MRKITPNFLVIGAARSGTTTLYNCLRHHPDIFVPPFKQPEPHFFYKKKEFEKGLDYYYERYFKEYAGEKMCGEVSASYLFSPESGDRIFDFNPKMKLVVTLRNPIDRAFSNYWHSVKNGIEKESFDFAVKNEPNRHDDLSPEWKEIAPFAYLGRSNYANQVKYYHDKFGKSQVHHVIFEDFLKNPSEEIKRLYRFLEVEDEIDVSGIGSISNKSTPKEESIPQDLRDYLINYFRPSNLQLSEMIERDLSFWNK